MIFILRMMTVPRVVSNPGYHHFYESDKGFQGFFIPFIKKEPDSGPAVIHPDDFCFEGTVDAENNHVHFGPGRDLDPALDPGAGDGDIAKPAFHLCGTVLDRADLVGSIALEFAAVPFTQIAGGLSKGAKKFEIF